MKRGDVVSTARTLTELTLAVLALAVPVRPARAIEQNCFSVNQETLVYRQSEAYGFIKPGTYALYHIGRKVDQVYFIADDEMLNVPLEKVSLRYVRAIPTAFRLEHRSATTSLLSVPQSTEPSVGRSRSA